MTGLTYLQQYGYNVLMAGYNVFLTGDAGTGKTYLVKLFIENVRKLGYNVMVTAPTGTAAINIDGITSHRAFDIPMGPLTFNKDTYGVSDELVETDIVVIDEISMCRIDAFDFIANKILKANNLRHRVGKPPIQLVLSGDFFQLAPVTMERERHVLNTYYRRDIGVGYAFDSIFWKMFDFKNIILTEVIRQNNLEHINNLNKIRVGDKSVIDYFINNSSQYELPNAVTLCGTNADAVEKNKVELNKINSEEIVYRAIVDGVVMENDTNAEMNLTLKVGARVIMIVNDKNIAYSNGTLGTVTNLFKDKIIVKLDSRLTIEVERNEWQVYKYELDTTLDKPKLLKTQIGTISQFPLKLAYAITIHKSQGQTYDAVNLNPYCWDCGQLYVALSRVKSLNKMYLKYSINPRDLVISLNVIKFYNSIVKEANQTIDTTVRLLEMNKQKESTQLDKDMNFLFNSLRGI